MLTQTPVTALKTANLDSIGRDALCVILGRHVDAYHFFAGLFEFGPDVGSGLIQVTIAFVPRETTQARLSFVAKDDGNGGWKLSEDHSVTFDAPECFDQAYHFWPWMNDHWMKRLTPPAVANRIRDMLSV